MLSTGLWRWYINITITILDIIHCPVFYLKLNSTQYVCPYLTGNTLRLRYEPNRLMLYIGLCRWYSNTTITILDIIHRIMFYLKLTSTLYVCPYLTGITLRLRYEPNRLMLYIGLCRWYINVTITILHIIHRRGLYLKHNVSENEFCLQLQGPETDTSSILWTNWVGTTRRQRQNQFSEKLCLNRRQEDR
jgi:hypothetical protein